jgi:DoxX-like family/Protein of unknown function (DUF3419)
VPRLAVALVWLYQGLWCKLLGRCPGHLAIVQGVPGFGGRTGLLVVLGLGTIETGLALWVLSGRRPYWAALAQTALLAGMNGGGLLWGRSHIADPGAMLTQNLAFLTLAWLVAARTAAVRAWRDGEANPWSRGRLDGRPGPPQLLFGRMHEDWRVEAAAFPSGGRIFCIASSGDTALALAARGFRVTAVDLNPAQIAYLRSRLAGGPPRPGVVEGQLAFARRFFPLLGWRRRDLRAFLELSDPSRQIAFWRVRLDTRRLRAALRIGFSPILLRATHARELVDWLPPRFDRILRGRLERTWARHPNLENPFAWRLFLGEEAPAARASEAGTAPAPLDAIETADAADFLAAGPAGRFDGFTLSNIFDAAPPAYAERLRAALRHAAAPGAVLVVRSFREPADARAAEGAAGDRGVLWGSVEVIAAISVGEVAVGDPEAIR